MGPLWSKTCWSTFKYFIILTVSTHDILCISWIIMCLIIVDARCKHEDYVKSFPTIMTHVRNINHDSADKWQVPTWTLPMLHCRNGSYSPLSSELELYKSLLPFQDPNPAFLCAGTACASLGLVHLHAGEVGFLECNAPARSTLHSHVPLNKEMSR